MEIRHDLQLVSTQDLPNPANPPPNLQPGSKTVGLVSSAPVMGLDPTSSIGDPQPMVSTGQPPSPTSAKPLSPTVNLPSQSGQGTSTKLATGPPLRVCQLSRIWRDSHAFDLLLMHSRNGQNYSRIFKKITRILTQFKKSKIMYYFLSNKLHYSKPIVFISVYKFTPVHHQQRKNISFLKIAICRNCKSQKMLAKYFLNRLNYTVFRILLMGGGGGGGVKYA